MYKDEEKTKLAPFLALRQELDPDPSHSSQVARLALILFDELLHIHKLDSEDRFLIHAAALCHDIGLVRGEKAHHKTSRDILLARRITDVSPIDQLLIALIARYHRKALPKSRHRYYKDLSQKDQLRVRKLAGILRIADGLDRTHRSVVKRLEVKDDGETVILYITTRHDASQERLAVAKKKQNLFEEVMNRKAKIVELSYQKSK